MPRALLRQEVELQVCHPLLEAAAAEKKLTDVETLSRPFEAGNALKEFLNLSSASLPECFCAGLTGTDNEMPVVRFLPFGKVTEISPSPVSSKRSKRVFRSPAAISSLSRRNFSFLSWANRTEPPLAVATGAPRILSDRSGLRRHSLGK